ncbi:hypothetical protein [Thiosocius teredinicola]|uniref:hypothetical protein n=1 Tax=Thiosocius teredinicola TaxID=1973002 RepID=UPI000990AE69
MVEETHNSFKLLDWIPIAISSIALLLTIWTLQWQRRIERKKNEANLELQWSNGYHTGSRDPHTIVSVVIRNLSQRPTAVVYLYVKNQDGGIVKNLDSLPNINLPIRLGPWDVQIIRFRVESSEEREVRQIEAIDIEHNNVVVKRIIRE